MANTTIYDVIVVGGGPAGSAAAAIAAKRGAAVLLLEASAHPRQHVGESLLPGIIPILKEMGCLAKVEAAGFEKKSGSWYRGFGPISWDLWFAETEAYEHAWFVDRPRFDQLLFEAAAEMGAETRENSPVVEVLEEEGRVAGVVYLRDGERINARARFVVDASGAAAIVARKRGVRRVLEGLKHRAHYTLYESKGRLDSPRHSQALFWGTSDSWIWFFPIGPARRSVGIVQMAGTTPSFDFEERIANSPIAELLGPSAERVAPISHARDWSYEVDTVVGPGWFAVGDASGFIDPVLSTGVMLAMHSGWHTARTILAILDGQDEQQKQDEYAAHHRMLFADLLASVRFFYQHNDNQHTLFWESKKALMAHYPLRPRKSFLVLTSGLVKNLAFDEVRAAQKRQTSRATKPMGPGEHDPSSLSFVCFELERNLEAEKPARLFFLIEPTDSSAPALFRTQNLDLNCPAPAYDNDPLSVPALAPPLRRLYETIDGLDKTSDEWTNAESTRPGAAVRHGFASWWRKNQHVLRATFDDLGPELRLVRIFGE